MNLTPSGLAERLGGLPVRVSAVSVKTGVAPVADYPGGRPTSVVRLEGGGHAGFGENVAFTAAEHEEFAARAEGLLLWDEAPVAARVDAEGPLHGRAALQAALIDLAMRQAGLSLGDLAGHRAARLRFVTSFDACADPVARIARLSATRGAREWKIDVEPTWDVTVQRALAAQPGVAILDFKGRGDGALFQRLAAAFPDALLEDPPPGMTGGRVARDAPLADARAVAEAVARHEAVNLKAPRMGGPLELLRGLAHALPAGVPVYLGGMFELGVGRRQARQLAALFCADAPNDLAPVLVARGDEPSPALVRLDQPGFGAGPPDEETSAFPARPR